jgi:hypothetical protein
MALQPWALAPASRWTAAFELPVCGGVIGSVIPKSGSRFSGKIVLKREASSFGGEAY